ncbi:hypothetical protein ROZALSC1DRAFT_21571 [Rozella allomycis CSF55]|uniref:Uncharacterized protein n=1 Tax=Rozella allomycis (strain CSF55) TaxID=988480 RepID=A0A4P9YL85_ROZAC|nr:hypothetical protein ROZALSC1DRAFT_21571 [Rozella allomycis CSF55]
MSSSTQSLRMMRVPELLKSYYNVTNRVHLGLKPWANDLRAAGVNLLNIRLGLHSQNKHRIRQIFGSACYLTMTITQHVFSCAHFLQINEVLTARNGQVRYSGIGIMWTMFNSYRTRLLTITSIMFCANSFLDLVERDQDMFITFTVARRVRSTVEIFCSAPCYIDRHVHDLRGCTGTSNDVENRSHIKPVSAMQSWSDKVPLSSSPFFTSGPQ